jgi:hypothetical protein
VAASLVRSGHDVASHMKGGTLGLFCSFPQWIGLRENLQETMVFTIKDGVFRLKIFPKPIH